MPGKELAKVHFADAGFRSELGIGQRRVVKVGLYVTDGRNQRIGTGARGIGKLVQKSIEDAEDLCPAAAKEEEGTQGLTIPQAALRIGQGDGQNLRAIQTFTGEVENREIAIPVTENAVRSVQGQKNGVVWVGKELLAILGIGKLTAAAEGQAVAAAVLHLHGLSLEKVDRGGFLDFGHCQITEDFQVASPG